MLGHCSLLCSRPVEADLFLSGMPSCSVGRHHVGGQSNFTRVRTAPINPSKKSAMFPYASPELSLTILKSLWPKFLPLHVISADKHRFRILVTSILDPGPLTQRWYLGNTFDVACMVAHARRVAVCLSVCLSVLRLVHELAYSWRLWLVSAQHLVLPNLLVAEIVFRASDYRRLTTEGVRCAGATAAHGRHVQPATEFCHTTSRTSPRGPFSHQSVSIGGD